MDQHVKCYDRVEVLQAIKEGDIPEIYGDFWFETQSTCTIIVREGSPRIHLSCWGAPTILTYGSSNPIIVAFDSSELTAKSYDSSTPYVGSANSSKVSIEAYDSSSWDIGGWGDNPVRIHAHDSSIIMVRCKCHVLSSSETSTIRVLEPSSEQEFAGGGKILRLTSSDPLEWINFFELPVVDGEYIYLYKALDENFRSSWGLYYRPGTTCEAPDWDPIPECGGGLHFSPTPKRAEVFYPEAKKFVACKVKISEMVVHHDGQFPEKVKAPKVYAIFEVDIEGNRT